MMIRYIAVALATLALLGGCQKKEDPSEAGPAERAGRKIDEATQQASQKLDTPRSRPTSSSPIPPRKPARSSTRQPTRPARS